MKTCKLDQGRSCDNSCIAYDYLKGCRATGSSLFSSYSGKAEVDLGLKEV